MVFVDSSMNFFCIFKVFLSKARMAVAVYSRLGSSFLIIYKSRTSAIYNFYGTHRAGVVNLRLGPDLASKIILPGQVKICR